MAWTDAETAQVESIELMLNKVQTALLNMAPKEMVRRYILLRQREITDLTTRLDALVARVAVLESSAGGSS